MRDVLIQRVSHINSIHSLFFLTFFLILFVQLVSYCHHFDFIFLLLNERLLFSNGIGITAPPLVMSSLLT